MKVTKVVREKSGYQSNENKRWDDINQKKSEGIAWNGAHTDASQIVAALINIGFYPSPFKVMPN